MGRDVKLRANYKQNWVRHKSEALVADFTDAAERQPRSAMQDV